MRVPIWAIGRTYPREHFSCSILAMADMWEELSSWRNKVHNDIQSPATAFSTIGLFVRDFAKNTAGNDSCLTVMRGGGPSSTWIPHSRWFMYYSVVVLRWCIALRRETWMRLTYRRDAIPDRDLLRDVLVCAEPVAAPA